MDNNDDALFAKWWAGDVRSFILGQPEITVANISFRAGIKSTKQAFHLTGLRRGLAVSILLNIIFLLMLLVSIGIR